MSKQGHVIAIEPAAPPKPALGAPCNGCGVCCLFAPCPLGMLLSRRRHGACAALQWQAGAGPYRCGALSAPEAVLAKALPRPLRGLAPWLAPWLARLGWRWIAAGQGCDSSLVVQRQANDGIPPVTAPENSPENASTMASGVPSRAPHPDPLPPPES